LRWVKLLAEGGVIFGATTSQHLAARIGALCFSSRSSRTVSAISVSQNAIPVATDLRSGAQYPANKTHASCCRWTRRFADDTREMARVF